MNITADKLFLKHAAKYLGPRLSDVQRVREAVEKGYMPAEQDKTIESYVEQLKQYLAAVGKPEEDDFLLRFALLAPGLQRGISPPIEALKAGRGGFSQRRVMEAAAQATRVREALRLGRLLGN